MKLKVNYDQRLSLLERNWIIEFENQLLEKKYTYYSIPSIVSFDTIENQEAIKPGDTFFFPIGKENFILAGSAEQGILEKFQGQEVKEHKLFATNQCFRKEPYYKENVRLPEFKKIEQFGFFNTKAFALIALYEFIENTTKFLQSKDIDCRVVDMTAVEGYHQMKFDVEIKTKNDGWLEVGSYTYFGEEQSKRFGIKGATHTVSGTGLAFPRVLATLLK